MINGLVEPLKSFLNDYMDRAGTNEQGGVRDVLTQLHHHCDEKGLDFDVISVDAEEVYNEEQQEEE